MSMKVTKEKQKILRMLVKEIIVGKDKIIIHHSIPLNEEKKTKNVKSYLLKIIVYKM